MGLHWRTRAQRCSTAVLAVVVLIAVGCANAETTTTAAVPAELVGEWTRKVTSADVTRTGARGVPAGTVCTLTMKKSDEAGVDCGPSVGGFEGTVVPAGTDRVHISLGISSPNVYMWRVSGPLLTFTKVKDGVLDREAVLGGVWKRQ